MGQFFLVVNPVKKQYLDANRVGEGIKRSNILRGRHGAAVGLLLCNTEQPPPAHPLIGAWVGDPVIVTGDYALPNPAGIKTTTPDNPSRNLYEMARQEFEDISHDAIIMLITDVPERAEEFARATEFASSLIVELGYIVFGPGCEPLRAALEKVLGSDWTKQYKEARDSSSGSGIRISSGQNQYFVTVAALTEAPNLADELKQANLKAQIEIYLAKDLRLADASVIRLGVKVPAEIAVSAIKLAELRWPFLKYVLVTDEFRDAPEFIHNQIFIGGHTKAATARQMRPWVEEDFAGLHEAMTLTDLHKYVKDRYGDRFKKR